MNGITKHLEISAVDREDLVVTARQNHGWIEIRVRNAVDVPVRLFEPGEVLLLVIVPEAAKRQPPTDAEMRSAILRRYRVE